MEIPKTFQLGGRTWTVKHQPDRVPKDKALARCYGGSCRIEIYRTRSEEELMHSFLHELFHAMSYMMGNKKLYHDEYFTDAMSSMLMQYMQTAK